MGGFYVQPSRLGVADGSSARPGEVGEIIQGQVLGAAGVNMVSAIDTLILSIALTAGRWLVHGQLIYVANALIAGYSGSFGGMCLSSIGAIEVDDSTRLNLPFSVPGFREAFTVPSREYFLAAPATLQLRSMAVFTGAGAVILGGGELIAVRTS